MLLGYPGDSTHASSLGTANANVTYKVVALYSETSKTNSGATIPVKVQLTNYSGKNLSSSSIVLTIAGLAPNPAPGVPPTGTFTFMSPLHQDNVKTTGVGVEKVTSISRFLT
ncbi:MAG TPA: hypothetical protein VN911_17975 [Candidatus Acidoferrum sp.]|nr:hypothetical protein [Candidatus Acidoferrum sp.]